MENLDWTIVALHPFEVVDIAVEVVDTAAAAVVDIVAVGDVGGSSVACSPSRRQKG